MDKDVLLELENMDEFKIAKKIANNLSKELGIEIKYLESKQDSDYATNVETLADEEVDLIIGVGSKLSDTIKEAAKNYPDQKFAIIDETYDEIPSNVKSVLFESEQASYLVGLIAGKMSETKNVGFIGGLDIPVINTFKYGYMAGVKAADANCEIQAQYANSFNDQAKGKAITNQMISKGADVIFPCAGACGTGAIEAVKEANKMSVGVDRDQYDLAPDNMLTSAMKNIDVAVANLVRDFVNGDYKGGEVKNGTLANNGVGLASTTDKNVSEKILKYVDEQAQEIKDGKIKVPSNEKELKEFNK